MSCPQKKSSRAKKKSTNLKFTEQRLVAEIAKALQLPSGRTSQGNRSKGTKVSRLSFSSRTNMAHWKITYWPVFSHDKHFFWWVFFVFSFQKIRNKYCKAWTQQCANQLWSWTPSRLRARFFSERRFWEPRSCQQCTWGFSWKFSMRKKTVTSAPSMFSKEIPAARKCWNFTVKSEWKRTFRMIFRRPLSASLTSKIEFTDWDFICIPERVITLVLTSSWQMACL